MKNSLVSSEREYTSGELVQPGLYLDVDNGALIEVHLSDELPVGSKIIEYKRRFRRVEEDSLESESVAA